MTTPTTKSRRGFAAMDPEKQRAIARLGGLAIPDEKRGFSVHRDLAVEAGRKGGLAGAASKKARLSRSVTKKARP